MFSASNHNIPLITQFVQDEKLYPVSKPPFFLKQLYFKTANRYGETRPQREALERKYGMISSVANAAIAFANAPFQAGWAIIKAAFTLFEKAEILFFIAAPILLVGLCVWLPGIATSLVALPIILLSQRIQERYARQLKENLPPVADLQRRQVVIKPETMKKLYSEALLPKKLLESIYKCNQLEWQEEYRKHVTAAKDFYRKHLITVNPPRSTSVRDHEALQQKLRLVF